MDGRPRWETAILLPQRVSTIDSDLIEFEQLVDGLRVTSSSQIQQSSSLVEFFFFRMGSSPFFHRAAFPSRNSNKLESNVAKM